MDAVSVESAIGSTRSSLSMSTGTSAEEEDLVFRTPFNARESSRASAAREKRASKRRVINFIVCYVRYCVLMKMKCERVSESVNLRNPRGVPD